MRTALKRLVIHESYWKEVGLLEEELITNPQIGQEVECGSTPYYNFS